MKKISAALVTAVLLSGTILIPQQPQAATFSAGMYGFYTYWNPAWRSVYSNTKNDPMLIWGPFLSVTFFQKLSFSAMFLQNRTNMSDSSYTIEDNGSGGPYTIDIDTTIDRNELDLTSNYKFSSGLSLFMGCKFLFYNLGHDGDNQRTINPATYNLYSTHKATRNNSTGAAAGASYSIPLSDNLVFTAGNALVFFNTMIELASSYEVSPGNIDFESISYKYKSLGDNVTGTFTYYIPAVSTTLSLGGRFQVLKHFSEGDAPSLANDYFYGVTLSAILHI